MPTASSDCESFETLWEKPYASRAYLVRDPQGVPAHVLRLLPIYDLASEQVMADKVALFTDEKTTIVDRRSFMLKLLTRQSEPIPYYDCDKEIH